MKLPVIAGDDAVKAFRKIGYHFDEQHGSHIILRRADRPTDVSQFPIIKSWPKAPFAR